MRKISRQIQDSIIDNIHSVVILHDLELRVVFVNEVFEEVFGIPKEDALGRSPMEFLPEFDKKHKQAIIKRLRNTMASGVKSPEHDFTYITPDGGYRYLSAVSTPIFNLKYELTHVLSEITDLTKQKKQEEDSVKTAQFTYITDMVYILAHEISNPLTGIKLGLGTLYGSLIKPENIQVLDSVLKDLNRIQNTVKSILYKKKTRPVYHTTKAGAICDMIDEIVFHLNYQIESKRIRLNRSTPFIGVDVNIDRDKIYQVLLNLFLNAIDAVPHGGEINVSLGKINRLNNSNGEKKTYLALTISDNGVGFDQEDVEKIFTPFFTLKSEGTGLGLSICREIVKQHGGVIEAQSELGVGTTIVASLPAN